MVVIDGDDVFTLDTDFGDGRLLLISDTITWLTRLSVLQELAERQEIQLREN